MAESCMLDSSIPISSVVISVYIPNSNEQGSFFLSYVLQNLLSRLKNISYGRLNEEFTDNLFFPTSN